jgi:uncharacterized protein YajQ (UPF0234 family)
MASFDIVSKIDMQKIDNAINTAKKELVNRYDLKDEQCNIELDKKAKQLRIEALQEMALDSMVDIILSKFSKQGLDVRLLDLTKEPQPSGKIVYKLLPVREGIDKETAKKINQYIKDSKLKVQASIMDDQIRVTSKSIDELQATMGKIRSHDFDVPLQFDNMRS